jgi:hypothetical protein
MAMRGNEELTNRRYDAALKDELPESCRTVVANNRNDERRHLAWIKDALTKKVWKRRPPDRLP